MIPTCLIVNFSGSQADWIVELLTGQSLAGRVANETVSWYIATKYYTATVQLKTVTAQEYLDIDTIGEVTDIEAVVFVCDHSMDTTCLVDAVRLRLQSKWTPSVCLLVSGQWDQDKLINDALSKQELLSWCLKNEFELVDLADEDTSDGSEDDFADTYGKERILEALLAHTWTNLVLVKEGAEKPTNSVVNVEDSDEEYGDFVACSEAESDIDFESLFSKLANMKDKASDLPDSERKAYAENVAIAFYKAMGGSEEDL